MEQDGKWHCKYDKDGNLTERYIGTGRWLDGKKEHWKYRWNADGSLAKVVRPDGEEVTFEYDALGRRLSKSFGATITRWMWNGNVPLHQWIQHRTYSWNDSNWEMKREHSGRLLWLFDERSFVPVAMIKEGRAYSIMTDHLGTPTQAYDPEGNEVWSRMLDMDGNVLEEAGNIGMIPFLFQGQYLTVKQDWHITDSDITRHRWGYIYRRIQSDLKEALRIFMHMSTILMCGMIYLHWRVLEVHICLDLKVVKCILVRVR